MSQNRTWSDYSNEEKLLIIESYLEGVAKLDSDDREVHAKHLEWLREHLPAHRDNARNYVFISYSHLDYKDVYHDLAFFSYNSETRLRFWYDEGLPAGKDWANAANARICDPHCVGVIFYLSEPFLRSPSVRQEIELLKASGKPFVTIALKDGKYSARSILTKAEDKALLDVLSETFPDENTALTFQHDYENKLYRIHKIASVFNVTEDVLSDFVCEEIEDGLSLKEYVGKKTEIHIPERIGNKNIVEITAEFKNAVTLFIPKTVKRILPHSIAPDLYEDIEDEQTATIFRIAEKWCGGYQTVERPLGVCPQLEAIYVDNENEHLCDCDGVLYTANGKLLRFPPNRQDTEGVLDGVSVIGQCAFADCRYCLELEIPSSVIEIEDGAFDGATLSCFEYGSNLKRVGRGAFNSANPGLMLDIPTSVTQIDAFAYRALQCNNSLFTGLLFGGATVIPRGACFAAGLRDVLFYKTPEHIDTGAFALCHNLRNIELEEGVRTIGDYAFMDCTAMTHVILPKSLEYVGEDAFYSCTSLKVIRYKGSTLQFLKLFAENPFLSEEQLRFVVCNDRPLRRLAARRLIKRIEKARKLLDID